MASLFFCLTFFCLVAETMIKPDWNKMLRSAIRNMKEGDIVIVHEAEEGGYWAEVPAIPGCATQGDTFEELLSNLNEAVEGCLSVDVPL